MNKQVKLQSSSRNLPKQLFSRDASKKVLVHLLLRNALITRGRKIFAFNVLTDVLLFLKKFSRGRNPYLVLRVGVNTLRPLFELRTKKVAAQKLKVPTYLVGERSYFYALLWLFDAAEARTDGTTFAEKIARELWGRL